MWPHYERYSVSSDHLYKNIDKYYPKPKSDLEWNGGIDETQNEVENSHNPLEKYKQSKLKDLLRTVVDTRRNFNTFVDKVYNGHTGEQPR